MYGNYGTNSLWNRPTLRPTYHAVTGSSDVDPEVAKQFPELVDLLERLKELNKLKDEGKLQIGQKPDINGQNDKLNGNTDHNNNGTAVPNNNGIKKPDGKPVDVGNAVIVIADGNIYFQAQPVVPENERKKMKETIYYLR